jgi:glycosyltransferase involved in cell wall biosynthesis
MRIGIDYTAAVSQGAGIGRYTRELIRSVIEQDSSFEYVLFYAAGGLDPNNPYLAQAHTLCKQHPNVSLKKIPLSHRRLTQLWQRLRFPLPVEVFTGKLDLLHSPDFVLPPTFAKTLLTIHDLSFLVHPECHVPSMVRYLSDAVPRSVRRAGSLFADSEATRQDLIKLLAVDPKQIQVVYPGVGEQFKPLGPIETEPVRQRLKLPEYFMLFVSTIEPRKNLVRLLEAFAQLIAEPQKSANPGIIEKLQFVIAGRHGWLYEDVFAAIERLKLQDRIQMLDFVDDKDLPALYNLAWMFTYPSIYEGFGLPALEALASGTPVVTANNSSLPEVVGDAAILVSANDTQGLSQALERLATDEALRMRLREAGPQRANTFTWEHAAQQVLSAYRAIANQ